MNADTIREVTQSVLAIIIIGGTIAIMFFQPASPALPAALTLSGVAGGFYYSRSTQAATVGAVLKAQDK